MKCSNCGTENPDGAKFCLNCGHALTLTCPNCATSNPAGARFCLNCGSALGQPVNAGTVAATGAAAAAIDTASPSLAPAREHTATHSPEVSGERRVVTILFCDVSNSTALAEAMDPEEWTGIMNEAFQRLLEPIPRYDGTIARLMGDAILAFFGAPTAHEDDPQRAVLAGLDILKGIRSYREDLRARYDIDFNVRVGINTGLAVVGKVGSDLRAEYTAMGDAVNLAARMEQTAQPGTLQIAEETYRQVTGLFDFQPLGGIEVKGKKEPVQA